MKKMFMKWSICLALVLMATACSNNSGMKSLLDRIPEKADLVLVGDVKTIVESAGGEIDNGGFVNDIKQSLGMSAGGSTIKLPSYITDELTGDVANNLETAQDFLKDGCVDISSCALAVNYDDPTPTIVFALTDEEKFVDAIKEEDYNREEERDDIVFYKKIEYSSEYGTEASFIAVADGYAYMLKDVWDDRDFDALRHLRRFVSNAKDKSFSSTKFADYITSGNAVGLAAKMPKELRNELINEGFPKKMADIYDGVICMKGNVESETATVSMKFFDNDGNEKAFDLLKDYANLDATINTKALSYLGSDEVLVMAGVCKDMNWDKYFDDMIGDNRLVDRATLSVIKAYLEKFDGTIAMSIGLRDGVRSLGIIDGNESKVMEEVPFTIVCETKAGKAQSILNDAKSLLDKEQIPYKNATGGLCLEIPELNYTFFLEARGDMLVFSNHKISAKNDNPTVSGVKVDQCSGMIAIVLSKNNPLMQQLDLDQNVQAVATTSYKTFETTMTLRMDGDESVGIIGKAAKAIMGIAGRSRSIESTFDDARESAYSYEPVYDADTLALDTAYAYYE